VPYIDPGSRRQIDPELYPLIDRLKRRTREGKDRNGEVVYVLYKILVEIYGQGNFEIKSNALKALESAKLEYYRRLMVPYENQKIQENGDV